MSAVSSSIALRPPISGKMRLPRACILLSIFVLYGNILPKEFLNSFLPYNGVPTYGFPQDAVGTRGSAAGSFSIFAAATVMFTPDEIEKYNALREYAIPENSYVTMLNYSGYQEYVLRSPRPYHLFVLYSSANFARCELCKDVMQAFKHVARSYFAVEKDMSIERNNLPVLFVFVDILAEQQIAALHNFKTIPMIGSIEEKTFAMKGGIARFRPHTLLDTRTIMESGASINFLTGKILGWQNMRANRDVLLVQTKGTQWGQISLFFAILSVVVAVIFHAAVFLRKNTFLVRIGGVMIFFLSISGIVFSIQNGMTLFEVNPQTGKLMIFDSNSRMQYYGEGALMAACNTAFGLSLYFLVWLSKTNYFKEYTKYFLFVLVGFICVILSRWCFHAYSYKASWYNPTFFPPQYYKHGPVRIDRGNSM